MTDQDRRGGAELEHQGPRQVLLCVGLGECRKRLRIGGRPSGGLARIYHHPLETLRSHDRTETAATGVAGGAALGGIAMLALGSAVGFGYDAVPPAAFVGALATTLLLYVVAGVHGRVSATQLLLTGVVFNAFASAAIVFLASLAGLVEGSRIFLWLIGNLSAARQDAMWIVALFLFVGLACALALSRSLNLLALGDEPAQHLGVSIEWHKRVLLLATSLMVGAAVSISGLIGFVGLIIPHLLRLSLGPDHRLLVPSAALAGAAFLVVSDTIARSVLGGRELPVGAITALVGGPLFLFLLRRYHSRAFAS
jgi:iron complex transport system permease protein